MLWAMLTLLLSALTCVAASAEPDGYYKGKTVKIIVGGSAGAGYDAYARLLARHMPKYLPGEPTMLVLNMPGADGIIAGNYLFNLAERDGTVLGTFNRYLVMLPLLGSTQAKFRPSEFNWIGTTSSYSDNSYLFVIRAALPQRSIDDLRDPAKSLFIGSVDSDVQQVLQEALGLKLKFVNGYKGKDDLEIAFNRGEIDGHTLGWTSILSRHQDWLKSGFIRPMIQFGRVDRLPALKDVPTARELASTPEDRALIEFAESPLLMARPFAAPPGVPTERVALLRKAFTATVNDPDYLSEAGRQQLELTPKSGEEVQTLAASVGNVPASVIERYKKAVGNRR